MKAVYPGSFDPLTFGHIELIERGLKLFEEVTFLIAHSSQKSALFSIEERKSLIHSVFKNDKRIKAEVTQGLTVDFLKENNIKTIIRGLRNSNDYEYEKNMSRYNTSLYPECETVFLFARSDREHLSSSGVKEVFFRSENFEKDLMHFVPVEVLKALKLKKEIK